MKATVGVAAGKLAVLPEDSLKSFGVNNEIEPRPMVGLGRSPRWGVSGKGVEIETRSWDDMLC